jgi:hypothetical protein
VICLCLIRVLRPKMTMRARRRNWRMRNPRKRRSRKDKAMRRNERLATIRSTLRKAIHFGLKASMTLLWLLNFVISVSLFSSSSEGNHPEKKKVKQAKQFIDSSKGMISLSSWFVSQW